MKIINKDVAYVQKNDIAYLNTTDLPIPLSIYAKVFGFETSIVNDNNRYSFIKLDDKSEIEYLKGIDFVVDYNDYKDLSEEEMTKILDSIKDEYYKVVDEFNAMTKEERTKHHNLITQSENLEFKYCTIRDILWFTQGHIKFELPEGVDYPKHYKKPISGKVFFNKPNSNVNNN